MPNSSRTSPTQQAGSSRQGPLSMSPTLKTSNASKPVLHLLKGVPSQGAVPRLVAKLKATQPAIKTVVPEDAA